MEHFLLVKSVKKEIIVHILTEKRNFLLYIRLACVNSILKAFVRKDHSVRLLTEKMN